jgi:hypothetical protein
MTTRLEVQVGALVNGLASELMARLKDQAQSSGLPEPCLISVLPGAVIPFDYCEEGGMAWSRLVGLTAIQATDPFSVCAVEYEITAELGVLRCAPILHEDGTLPVMEEYVASSLQQNADMGLMHHILSCWTAPPSFTGPAIDSYIPIGPDGGCVGGIWAARWRFS